MPASESQMAAAQLAAYVEGLNQWMWSNRLTLKRREDSANVDRNWVTASQADRHSTLSMSQQGLLSVAHVSTSYVS